MRGTQKIYALASSANALGWLEKLLLVSIIGGCYTLIFIGAYHSYPNAEELELSAAPRDLGIVRSMLNLMISYDGRYATNFIQAINPLVFNSIRGFQWMLAFTVPLFNFSLYYFLIGFFSKKNNTKTWLLSTLIALVFIGCVLILPNALYWMGASFVYLYPCIFSLLFMGSLIRYIENTQVYDTLYFLFSFFSLIIGIGFNEMFLPFYFLLLIGLLIYFWFNSRTIFHKILPLSLAGFACILFFIVTPGVSNRLSDSEKIITSPIFLNCFKNMFLTLFVTIKKPIVFCCLLYVAFLFAEKNIQLKYELTKNKLAIVVFIVLLLAYLMSLVYYLPKQDNSGYPLRTYPPILFLVLTVSFVLMTGFFKIFTSLYSILKRYKLTGYLRVILLSIMLFSFAIGNNNIALLLSDYSSGRMGNFKNFMKGRIEKIETIKKSNAKYKTCSLLELGHDYPTSIYCYPDMESKRSESIWNKYHEEYFRIDEIITANDTTNRFE